MLATERHKSAEDYCTVAVGQDPMFREKPHGFGQSLGFLRLSFADELRDAHGVIDTHHVLFDDWSLVEIAGHKVCRCPY